MVQDKLEHFLKLFKENIGADFPFTIPKDIVDLSLDSIPSQSRDGIFFGYPQNTKLYVIQEQKELFFEEVKPDYFVFGMWGHGMNSFAQYFFFVDKNTKIACRLMHGGIYMNNERQASEIQKIYKKVKKIIEHPNKDKHQIEFMNFGDVSMARFDGVDLENKQPGKKLLDDILKTLDKNKPFIPTIENFCQYFIDIYGIYVMSRVFEMKDNKIKYCNQFSTNREDPHEELRDSIRIKKNIKAFLYPKVYEIVKEKFSDKNRNAILKKLEKKIENLRNSENEKKEKNQRLTDELTKRKELIQSKEFKEFYKDLIDNFSQEYERLWEYAIYDLPGFNGWIDFSNREQNKSIKPILIIGLDPSPAIKERLGVCYGIGRPKYIVPNPKQIAPEGKFLEYYSNLFGLKVDQFKTKIIAIDLSPFI